MKKYLSLLGLSALIISGCSNSNEESTQTEPTEIETEETVKEEDTPIEKRDMSYIELNNYLAEMMNLATNIKGNDIDLDSDIAKQKISEISPEIMARINDSRENIIPNLEQNVENQYYSQFIDQFEFLITKLEYAINNKDYPTWKEFSDAVPAFQKTITDFGIAVGIQ